MRLLYAWMIVGAAACLPEAPASLCQLGTTTCGEICAELDRDPRHCGTCGNACSNGLCVAGQCQPLCGALQACGASCVDVATDPAHCGACDQACSDGQICTDGACVDGCLGAAQSCGGVCVDVASDEASCGGCDTACEANETCREGVCGCVDILADPNHCGACGEACLTGQACVEGRCRSLCDGVPCEPGATIWGTRIGDDGNARFQRVLSLATRPDGQVTAAIPLRGPAFVGEERLGLNSAVHDVFATVDDDGQASAWAIDAVMGGTFSMGSQTAFPWGIVHLPDGDLLIAGTRNSTSLCGLPATPDGLEGFVARLSANGTCSWAVELRGADDQEMRAVTLAEDGTWWAAGFTDDSATVDGPSGAMDVSVPNDDGAGNTHGVLIHGDAGGAVLRTILVTGPGLHELRDVAATEDGVAVVGSYDAPFSVVEGEELVNDTGRRAIFAAAYDPQGNPLWARGFPVSSTLGNHQADGLGLTTTARGVALIGEVRGTLELGEDAEGNALGSTGSNNGTKDVWVAELDVDGHPLWWQFLGDQGHEEAYAIAGDDPLYVVGTFEQQITLGPDTFSSGPINPGDEIFVSALEPPATSEDEPTVLWGRAILGEANEVPFALTLAPGQVVIGGGFRASLDWGQGPMWSRPNTNGTQEDGFIIALAR